jgi:DNA-binding PadR family transcriptional regulator
MSLRHAILTALLDGDASGYDLAKRFDLSVGNFWHALPAQLYPELNRLEDDGLVDATEVQQKRRPTKRLFAINDAGRAELRRWVALPSRPFALKDELMVRLRVGADTDPGPMIEALRARRDRSGAKLERYLATRAGMLGGRTEAQFLETAERVGPFLTVNAGIALERAHQRWIAETIASLLSRTAGRSSTSGSPTAPP